MLRELYIEDFAIIDRLELSFSGGLNVLTGETGTGKSIIIDAVQLLLGGRAAAGMVRAGARRAVITGLFDLADAPWCLQELAAMGIDVGDGQVQLGREITAEGRSTARINGRPVTVGQLREAAAPLLDIHGQHQHQRLLSPRSHRAFLDEFIKTSLGAAGARALEQLQAAYRRFQDLRRQMADLAGDPAQRLRTMDLYRFQRDEIDAAALAPDEEEELRARRRLLQNAARVGEALLGAYELLAGDGREGAGAHDAVGGAIAQLEAVAQWDPQVAPLLETLYAAQEELAGVARHLRQRFDEVQADPADLAAVEERLMLIGDLKKKYGGSVEEILAYRDRVAAELDRLAGAEEAMEKLQQQLEDGRRELAALSRQVSDLRRQGAARLEPLLASSLAELGMAGATFSVGFAWREDPDGVPWEGGPAAVDAGGVDEVEFLISTNPGEPLRPLAQTASGGELSRIMLALKSLMAQANDVPTVVFDEIDSGVGGRTAVAVADKLAAIARRQQVLCVTHLPVIAAAAHRHFTVSKQDAGGRTVTRVVLLEEEERRHELARMLGGDTHEAALAHARELLERARADSLS